MRLIPREEKFFTHFGEQTQIILKAAKLLHANARNGHEGMEAAAREINLLEGQCDEITHEIYKKLNQTFITPIDPEDIHSLALHLDDCLDSLEESAHRIVAYRLAVIPAEMIELARIIEQCAEITVKAFDALRTGRKLLDYCIEINRLEEEADKLTRTVVAGLINGHGNAIEILKLKEIYDLLEATTDNFEDVADALQNVEVKNS